jgi:5-hydroxyisourate hydrolase
MSTITTHVLDVVLGKPAAGIAVRLEWYDSETWVAVAVSATDEEGRCRDLAQNAASGIYRLTFETGGYLARNGRSSIYPEISIIFVCVEGSHYHLPLLLSDNGYTTYRGS